MIDERGGIISKLLIITVGVVLVLAFFFLGYYMGKFENKIISRGETLPPMPEVESKNPPKPEEFTFYKTLSEKENRTVSIDLTSKNGNTDSGSESTEMPDTSRSTEQSKAKESGGEPKTEKKSLSQETAGKAAAAQRLPIEKTTVSGKEVKTAKLRYTIQVSSHPEKKMAEEDVKRMKQSGFAAYIAISELQGKGTWYRVRIGSFASRNAAEKLRQEILAKAGMASIIVLE